MSTTSQAKRRRRQCRLDMRYRPRGGKLVIPNKGAGMNKSASKKKA